MTFRWINQEDVALRRFQFKADLIGGMILNPRIPWTDIEKTIARLRREAEQRFPDRAHLFELIYGSRFRRLRSQFRGEDAEGTFDPLHPAT